MYLPLSNAINSHLQQCYLTSTSAVAVYVVEPLFPWIDCLIPLTQDRMLPVWEEPWVYPLESSEQTAACCHSSCGLCRPGYADWLLQWRALSTTLVKLVHKYCRVTLCLSAAANLPTLTWQLCRGDTLPGDTAHTLTGLIYSDVYLYACCF